MRGPLQSYFPLLLQTDKTSPANYILAMGLSHILSRHPTPFPAMPPNFLPQAKHTSPQQKYKPVHPVYDAPTSAPIPRDSYPPCTSQYPPDAVYPPNRVGWSRRTHSSLRSDSCLCAGESVMGRRWRSGVRGACGEETSTASSTVVWRYSDHVVEGRQ
jgi:hypothetical protein